MKYWFFDGNDVVGPFEPQELAARPGFAATSLVCPENYSENQDNWKLAATFDDFHFSTKDLPDIEQPQPNENTDSFDAELDTLLKARSPLGDLDAGPSVEAPALEVPKKPAKPGPIEDYFNNIKGEDLGDILGIPDPNENSDMNLARALQKQFNKTTPPPDKEVQPLENDPFDEFTSPDSSEAEELPFPQEEALPEKPLPVPEAPKPAEPESVPMSDSPEEEMILTVHGQPPAKQTPVPPQEPAPQPQAASPADSAPKAEPAQTKQTSVPPQEKKLQEPQEEQEASSCQLPVLGQAETSLPPLPQQEPLDVVPLAAAQPPAEDTLSAPEISQPKPQEPLLKESPASPVQAPVSEPPSARSAAEENATSTPSQPEELVPHTQEQEDPKEKTVQHILEGKLNVQLSPEIPEPIKNVPVEAKVNQVRPHLKQTPEIKEFLTQTKSERIEREKAQKKAMAALAVLIALLAVGAAMYLNNHLSQAPANTALAPSAVQEAVPAAEPQEEPDTTELLPEIPVPQPAVEPDLKETALSVVQNYPLSGNRGTVAAYLDRIYQSKKAQGYTGAWSVEPLHKSTYIVKYRLTKTRTEPIVYVFQADAAQGKLTGALNNITLDLVGKIQE